MKKQTAVEWLVNEILTDVAKYDFNGNVTGIIYTSKFHDSYDLAKFVEQAKQMEKQQIEDAWNSGSDCANFGNLLDSSELYYQHIHGDGA